MPKTIWLVLDRFKEKIIVPSKADHLKKYKEMCSMYDNSDSVLVAGVVQFNCQIYNISLSTMNRIRALLLIPVTIVLIQILTA